MAGFGDCDGLPQNGCESDLSSAATCGSCTNACPTAVSCVDGVCAGVACVAPAAGVLAPGSTVIGTLPAASGRFPVPSCATQSTGFEDHWTITLTSARTVTFETGGTMDTVLFVRANCGAASDLGCSDDAPGIGTLSEVTLTLQPGSYSVFVKRSGTGGAGGLSYSLSATLDAASHASCLTPMVLSPGVPVLAQDTSHGTSRSTACLPGQGNQLFYRVAVPARQRATISVTSAGVWGPSIRLLDDCAATSCLASTDNFSAQHQLTFDNRSGLTRTILVAVSWSFGAGGLFDIRNDLGPIPLALNASCANATPLTPGAPLTSERLELGGDPLDGVCMPGQRGLVLYYSVVVPARGSVGVGAQGSQLGLRALEACSSSCFAHTDTVIGGYGVGLLLTNADSAPKTFIVAVSSAAPGSELFSIGANSLSPPPPEFFCDTAVPLTLGVPTQQGGTGGMPLDDVCLPTTLGFTRYFSVAVPPGSTLHATAIPTTMVGLPVGLRVFSSCPATSCLAASGVFGAQNALVNNVSGVPQTYVVATSGRSADTNPSYSYEVTAHVRATAPNAFPSGATPVALGQVVTDTLSGAGPANTACLPDRNGPTKHYVVTVAPSERVALTASPTDFRISTALRVFDSCPVGCAASSDFGRLTVQNDTAAAKDYVIAVTGDGRASPDAGYTLSVQRAGYRTTDIAASCDDLSLVAGLDAPFGWTTVLPLPPAFAFQLFGVPMTHYTVDRRGVAQLHSSASPIQDVIRGENSGLPNGFRNGVVAPFWDDLLAAPTTQLRSVQQGSAPNRVFTIEWFEVAFNMYRPGVERLRFQARLFETSNVIEFHYCSLEANGGSGARVTGGSATIGIGNELGTEGIQRSLNAPGSVSSGMGMRFTPQ